MTTQCIGVAVINVIDCFNLIVMIPRLCVLREEVGSATNVVPGWSQLLEIKIKIMN